MLFVNCPKSSIFFVIYENLLSVPIAVLQVESFTLIKTNLCKWCDHSSPVCEDNVCMSNCSLTSYCTLTEEVCVAIW